MESILGKKNKFKDQDIPKTAFQSFWSAVRTALDESHAPSNAALDKVRRRS